MIGDVGEQVGKILLRVETVELGALDQGVDRSGAAAAGIGASEQIIFSGLSQSSVHSAHVGQELEVHYRYHPYFGGKVLVRCVEQRATGRFLKVQGSAGIVVSIAGWMLDPVICGAMTIGRPRVDLAALVELRRLLMGVSKP